MVLDGIERDVVEACQRGEPEAFRALFEMYKDMVYSIALRYTGDQSSAMDVAQDTFLKLFSSIRTVHEEASFEAWLYRLVVNSCLDQKRRKRRFMPCLEHFFQSLQFSGESVLQKLIREELSEQVVAAVATLVPEQRIVIVLRYTEGLSYAAIADALGCSIGTVASRLNRAHTLLERRLGYLVSGKGELGNE
jgi:RNA polymerase sigma-70 factor, ECF subfamily